jgi:hypothetical protein
VVIGESHSYESEEIAVFLEASEESWGASLKTHDFEIRLNLALWLQVTLVVFCRGEEAWG